MGEDPFHNRLPGRAASGKIGLVDAAPADIHATRGDPNALVWQADDPFDTLGIVSAAATQENDVAALNPTEPAPEPPDQQAVAFQQEWLHASAGNPDPRAADQG